MSPNKFIVIMEGIIGKNHIKLWPWSSITDNGSGEHSITNRIGNATCYLNILKENMVP